MEYLEILLTDVNKQYIDSIVRQELKITTDMVASSHFFDKPKNRDMEYGEISNLASYFSTPNTANIFVKELTLGENITNVMVVMSFDADFGDITLNFCECDFITDDINILKSKVISIVNRLIEIQREYEISSIRLGYESAIDDENVVLNITNGEIVVPNKFQGQLALAIEQAY
ncbi:hypothetical protein [Lacrimispora sp.]|jgi:hypothetical protein|uniref:hypothetical protein n=1 Tax=Lacrimispora sp. TaxID=2719234 RepID=UPI0028A03C68|nr:hypothetical protein [Lacrimispora sp.]